MDQWRSKFSESFSLDRYWSIECSSLLNLPKRKERVVTALEKEKDRVQKAGDHPMIRSVKILAENFAQAPEALSARSPGDRSGGRPE